MNRETIVAALDAVSTSNIRECEDLLRLALAEADKPIEGQPAACSVSVDTLSGMFEPMEGLDRNQPGYEWRRGWNDALRRVMGYASPLAPDHLTPIDMVLRCPACGLQHIDEPERSLGPGNTESLDWANPPHRSHLCHGCGHIWRPADVCTNGVAAVKTRGKADSPIVGASR